MSNKRLWVVLIFILNWLLVTAGDTNPNTDTDNTVAPYLTQIQDLNNQLNNEHSLLEQFSQEAIALRKENAILQNNQALLIVILIICALCVFGVIFNIVYLKKIMLNIDKFENSPDKFLSIEEKVLAIEEKQMEILQSVSSLSRKLDLASNGSTQLETVKEPASTSKSTAKIVKKNQPIKEKYYAMPQLESSSIILTLSQEDSYKEYMPFILESIGEQGVVSFNNASIQNSLSNFEIDVKPYADTKIESDHPTLVKMAKSGKARLENDKWILIEKPSLIFV